MEKHALIRLIKCLNNELAPRYFIYQKIYSCFSNAQYILRSELNYFVIPLDDSLFLYNKEEFKATRLLGVYNTHIAMDYLSGWPISKELYEVLYEEFK